MDKTFLHDCILDCENQMCECVELISHKRAKLTTGNIKLISMDIYALCGTLKNLAEEMQEKIGEEI